MPSTVDIPSEEGIKKFYLITYLLTIGIGALVGGFGAGVFNSLMTDLMIVLNVEKGMISIWQARLTTFGTIGGATGALFSASLMKFGLRNCIIFNNLLNCLGCALTLITNLWIIGFGRFL